MGRLEERLMVTIPQYSPQVSAARRNETAVQPGVVDVQPLAQGLGAAADAADRLDFTIRDREDTAAAKAADAMASEQIRELLYNPETGFTAKQGAAAVHEWGSLEDHFEKIRESALAGLSKGAQRKVEESIARRIESGKLTADRHTMTARQSWLEGAAAARISAAQQDAIFDPGRMEESLGIIRAETAEEGRRNGWAPELVTETYRQRSSAAYAGHIQRIANVDPVAAMRVLRDKQDEMQASDVVRLEGVLTGAVKDFQGRELGRQADMIANTTPDALDALSTLETNLGMPLKIISGYRDPSHNAKVGGASNSQHIHGNAFDVDVSGMSVEQRKELIRQARQSGFSGVGVYGNSMHFDVGPTRAWGPSYSADSLPAWAVEAVNEPVSAARMILENPDPRVRDAAFQELNLRESVRANERDKSMQAAHDMAFQAIERGQFLADIPQEVRDTIGRAGMSALMSYEATIRAGLKPETNPETYATLYRMAAEEPGRFATQDPLTWLNDLSETDYQEMVRLQAQTIGREPKTINPKSASSLMTATTRALEAAGVADDPKQVAAIETQMLKWQNAFIEANGRSPDPLEVNEQANRLMVPLVFGTWNPLGGKEVTFGASQGMDAADLKKINGKPVPPDAIESARRYFISLGVQEPTDEMIISELIASGMFDE